VKKILFFLIAVSLTVPVIRIGAQEGLSITIVPQAVMPIGSMSGDFGFGGGAELNVDYRMPFAQWLFARVGAGYFSSKNSITSENLSLIPVYAGVGVVLPAQSRLAATLAIGAGYGTGLYSGESGGSLYYRGDAGIQFAVNPAFALGLGVTYHVVSSKPDPLYQGIGFGLSLTYSPGRAASRSKIEYQNIQLDPVFPVFYKYYDESPIGAVSIANEEGGKIEDIRISFYTKRYMDEPKFSAIIPEMKKGETKTIPLFALFNSDVLNITESDKAAARIAIDYSYQGDDRRSETQATLELFHRNAITWDDDRKAAAFVTANDPDVIRFSNAVAGTVREDGGRTVNLDFSIGMAMFQALELQGLNYVIDPSSSYAELSQNKFAVDYLKYPGETLYYGAGDCDDLSTCYNALLSSVGIETAYITIPGHIFMAFALNMEPEEAEKTFLKPENLIFRDNRVWVPVETTMVSDGFLDAWTMGAKQWRDNNEMGRADFWPVREAQAIYAPVGASNAGEIDIPSPSAILDAFVSENRRFIHLEIDDRETRLKTAVDSSVGAPRDINRLGLLYARYGLYPEAKIQFKKAADKDSIPAMVNLGNVLYLSGDYRKAADSYQRVLKHSPNSPRALLGLAKSQYELENLGEVKETYTRLKETNPELAEKYAYLGGGGTGTARAGALDYREVAEWED